MLKQYRPKYPGYNCVVKSNWVNFLKIKLICITYYDWNLRRIGTNPLIFLYREVPSSIGVERSFCNIQKNPKDFIFILEIYFRIYNFFKYKESFKCIDTTISCLRKVTYKDNLKIDVIKHLWEWSMTFCLMFIRGISDRMYKILLRLDLT